MDTYQAGRTEDEESKKQELIKRGLAALNIEGAAEAKEEDMQQKRREFMTGLRDAIIAGDEGATVSKKKKKKKE